MTENTGSTARSLDKLHRDKEATLRKSNQFFAYIEDVHEQDGHNPRNYNLSSMQAHIRGIADSYKNGQFVEPIIVQVVDGKIVVRDGHCRRRAMLLAQSEGADLGQIPLIEFRGDEVEADALILTSQAGKRLTAVEVASMYNRMANRGKTEAEIAKLVGKSVPHVKGYLDFHTYPQDIKRLVEEEVVSYSLACKTFNELGTKAAEVLKHGVEEQLCQGKTKLTEKSLNKGVAKAGMRPRPKPIPKKVASRMANHITSWATRLEDMDVAKDGSATLTLSAEEVEAIRELRSTLPADQPKDTSSKDGDD